MSDNKTITYNMKFKPCSGDPNGTGFCERPNCERDCKVVPTEPVSSLPSPVERPNRYDLAKPLAAKIWYEQHKEPTPDDYVIEGARWEREYQEPLLAAKDAELFEKTEQLNVANSRIWDLNKDVINLDELQSRYSLAWHTETASRIRWQSRAEAAERSLDIEKGAVAALSAVIDAQGKWVDVKERLPEGKRPVMTCKMGDKYAYLAYRDGESWRSQSDGYLLDRTRITHWRPLPAPPATATEESK